MSMRSEEEVEVGSQSGTLTGRGASPRAHYRVCSAAARVARVPSRAISTPCRGAPPRVPLCLLSAETPADAAHVLQDPPGQQGAATGTLERCPQRWRAH
jgi:hypothetical protein